MNRLGEIFGKIAMSVYIGAAMLLAFGCILSCVAICFGHLFIPAIFCTIMGILLFLPTGDIPPAWAMKFTKFAMDAFAERTNFRVVYEDDNTFRRDQPCVIGYEPHSVFPFGLPQVFSNVGQHRANLKSVNTLVTSMVDWCPLLRHLFHWLDAAPASRATMHKILDQEGSVVVIPGGVAECAYMAPGTDVVFLKSRRGFVRIALQHGVPLVPCYTFGQSSCYSFIRLWPPFMPAWLYNKVVRKLLFCPMLVFGSWGTPVPRSFRVDLYMVIGKPIPLPRIAEPAAEDVQRYLDLFIDAMQGIYQRHQAEAGYPDSSLVVM